uniref:Pecanex-like protein n=2 Tax=Schistocephalus solidus TaxID=70667 RepID=A0A0X3Q7K1_SCHSO
MCMIGTIFREGIIASLTGGFFLDPSQGYVVSCIHMYLWLYFFIVPLAITLIKPQSIIAWTVYSLTVVLLFGIIQYLTYRLHKTFDECEPISQAAGFYSDVCNVEATENLKQRTYDQTDSALSLDSSCPRTATNIEASVENIEEQCRRIGIAGQYLADLMSPPNAAPKESDFTANPVAGPSQPRPPTPIPPRMLPTPNDSTPNCLPFSDGCRPSNVPPPRPRGIRLRLGVRMLDNRQGMSNDKHPPTLPVAYPNCINGDKVGNLEEQDAHGKVTEGPDDALAFCRTDTDPYSNLEVANSSAQTMLPSGPESCRSKGVPALRRHSQVTRQFSAPTSYALGPQHDLSCCGLDHNSSLRQYFESPPDGLFRLSDAPHQYSTTVSVIRLNEMQPSASPAIREVLRRHIEKLRDEVGRLPYFQSSAVTASDNPNGKNSEKSETAVTNRPRTVRPVRSRSICGRYDQLHYSFGGHHRMSRRRPGSILRLRHEQQTAATSNYASVCSATTAAAHARHNQTDETGTAADHLALVTKGFNSDYLSAASNTRAAAAAASIYDYPTDELSQPPEPATTSEGGGLDMPPQGDLSPTPKAEFFRTCSLPERTIAVGHELPGQVLSTLSLQKGDLEEEKHVGDDRMLPSMSADLLYSPPSQSTWEISKPLGTSLPAPNKKKAKSTPSVDTSCLLANQKPSLQSSIYDEILPLSQAEDHLPPRTSPILRRVPASHKPQYRRRAIRMPMPPKRPSPRSSRHNVSIGNNSLLTMKTGTQPGIPAMQQQQSLFPSRSCGADCNTAVSSHDAVHLLVQPTQHRRRHLRSSFRLPFFPPNVHSLDHAYSSPIRNNLMPRQNGSGLPITEGSTSSTTNWNADSSAEKFPSLTNYASGEQSTRYVPRFRSRSSRRFRKKLRPSSSTPSVVKLDDPAREPPTQSQATEGSTHVGIYENDNESIILQSGQTRDVGVGDDGAGAASTAVNALAPGTSEPPYERSGQGVFSSPQNVRGRASSKPSRRVNIAYRVRLLPFIPRYCIIRFDRLQLSALFDRKTSLLEALLTLLLSALVAAIGSCLLSSGAFRNFSLFCCCCVMAGCHFSLVKSVQPDPASPRHGFNHLIVFSRSFLFCLLGAIFVGIFVATAPNSFPASGPWEGITWPLADGRMVVPVEDLCGPKFFFGPISDPVVAVADSINSLQASEIKLYGFTLNPIQLACGFKDFCGFLLLAFPLVFVVGLVPQLNTMLIYLLEQIEIHIFGGTGTANLGSALFSVFRSTFVAILGFGLCYSGAMRRNPQDIFLSLFWGLYLALCFLLARLPNNALIYCIMSDSFNNSDKSSNKPLTVPCSLASRVSASIRSLFVFKPEEQHQFQRWQQQHNHHQQRQRHQQSAGEIDSLLSSVNNLDSSRKSADREGGGRRSREEESVFAGSLTAVGLALRRSQPSVSLDRRAVRRSCELFPRPSVSQRPLPTPEDTFLLSSPPGESTTCSISDRRTMSAQIKWAVPSSPHNIHVLPRAGATGPPSVFDADISQLSTVPEQEETTLAPTFGAETNAAYGDGAQGPAAVETSDANDPLWTRVVSTMLVRQRNDFVVFFVWAVLGFAVHVSTFFTVPSLQPVLPKVLIWVAIVWGFALHYFWPQLRKPYPWLIFAHPACAPSPDGGLASYEVAYYWCHWFEKYFLVPAVTLSTSTQALPALINKFGAFWTSVILLIVSMKMLRNGFSGAHRVFLNLFFAHVLFTCDFPGLSETLPIDYFFVSIFISKISELWNKLCFIYMYIAPFQAGWGSIFHAVAQLGSIPHFMFILGNCIFSTIISAPLEPFVASVFFITSYARPIRFWEATQKIRRIESTTTPLMSQLRGVSFEQVTANLNAIFYEHLARSLQQRLAGDIALGRWSGGSLQHGDVFILASDELHFLVHIIEVGNGLITFQMRGLEFAGTYCHEQESNGLNEAHQLDRGLCCCTVNYPSETLSVNAALRLRWLAWQFVHTPYTIEGYQLIDHSAATSLQLTDLRKLVLALFIQCVLYFTVRLPNLASRLDALSDVLLEKFTGDDKLDLDPVFSKTFDEDYDEHLAGVTRIQFVRVYGEWIRYCLQRSLRNCSIDSTEQSLLMSLCYAIGLLSRRCLGGVSSHPNSALETFLHYLHDVFKGDVQVASKDDWVFRDVDILKLVVTPAMRVALKLYQDHFTWNPLSTNGELYSAIQTTIHTVVICHETDPQWRSAVLNDADKLFSFRRIDSGTTQQCYRFIMMTKQMLNFQVIKLNTECVRGFWAGQQREQIFLRNNNPERGSIQHAKHVLRNLINSSCDQPIGYPIYVSPLITSFVETHPQCRRIACPSVSIPGALRSLYKVRDRLKLYCNRSCSGQVEMELRHLSASQKLLSRVTGGSGAGNMKLQTTSRQGSRACSRGSLASTSRGNSDVAPWCAEAAAMQAGFMNDSHSSAIAAPLSSSTTLSAVVHRTIGDSECISPPALSSPTPPPPTSPHDVMSIRVKIVDPSQILDDRLFKLTWPSTALLASCLPQASCPLSSLSDVEGNLVHRWTPSNVDPRARSFCHRTISLVCFSDGPPILEGRCVAVWEDLGLKVLSPPPAF